jgi:hypothetical protein
MKTHTLQTALLALTLAAPLVAPAFAHADEAPFPEFRLTLRGGLNVVEDDSWQAVGDGRLMGGGELGFDAILGDRLFVGASYGGRSMSGETYGLVDSTLGGSTLRAGAGWRWRPDPIFQLYGRAGLGCAWWTLDYDPRSTGETISASATRPGFYAGVGMDLWFMGPGDAPVTTRADRFAFGANLEITYDRFLPAEFKHDGRSLGTIDPSGPGFLFGGVLQF